MEVKKNKKGIIIAVVIFVALIAVMVFVYTENKAETNSGSKQIAIVVADADGNETSYELATDQEYLQGALDELAGNQDFSYDGLDQDTGFMIQEINGIKAVYEDDGTYWAMYLNGEYAQYGIREQVVTDGDEYKFAVESM